VDGSLREFCGRSGNLLYCVARLMDRLFPGVKSFASLEIVSGESDQK